MTVRINRYLLAVMGFLAASAAALPASRSAGAHENEIAIGADGEVRVIRSNGVSEHKVGEFPNRGNPNTIVPQSHTFRVPMNPVPANRPVPLRRGMMFGLAAEAWHAEKRAGRRSRRTIR